MSAFDASKASILHNISTGVDFSFKGSIDAPVLELVNFINDLDNYYTTSSCSGRVSVFRNGSSAKSIHWLLVRHRQITKAELMGALNEPESTQEFVGGIVALKCEPFILHINCRDLESARQLHEVVTSCGFRESGIKLGNKKVMLAVRTTANGMELPLARGMDLLVSDSYLDLIVGECNARLASNFARIDKFLLELKRHFGWPRLQLQGPTPSSGAQSELAVVKRWGHTCCTSANASGASTYVIGGYGANTMGLEERSQRGLECLLLNADPHQQGGSSSKALSTVPLADDCMHAVSEIVRLQREGDSQPATLLLVSGGRQSPSVALPCLRLYDTAKGHYAATFTVANEHDQPAPRWGHTLTRIRQHRDSCAFLLVGGRDSTTVFNDAYILHISSAEPAQQYICRWEKLNLCMENGVSSPVSARFFHAACATPNVFPKDDSPSSQDYDMVVLHGGVLDIQDPRCCGTAFVIDPNTSTVGELFAAQPDATREKSSEADAAVISGPPRRPERGITYVPRFGHTLTSVGAKCLLLLGGAAFEDSASASTGTLLLDLYIDGAGRYRGSVRPLEDASSGGEGQRVQPATLPCQACRAHHQVLYDPRSRLLEVVGGGVLTLAFGAHHCTPWAARLVCRQETSIDGGAAARGTALAAPATPSAKPGAQRGGASESHQEGSISDLGVADLLVPSAAATSNCPVLLLPAQSVRPVKVFLEARGWLDKSQSIAKVEEAALIGCNTGSCLYELSCQDGEGGGSAVVTAVDAQHAVDRLCAAGVTHMAVPLSDGLSKELLALGSRTPSAEVSALLQEVRSVTKQPAVLLGQYSTRSSKRSQVNSAQKANDLLLALGAKHRLPVCSDPASASTSTASGSVALHSRFEVVGDVLMLPEPYLSGPHWEAVLGLAVDAQGNLTSDSANPVAEGYRQQVLAALAACFGLGRVARKAEIDSGPRRESKVRLLHPTVGQPATTGPGTQGWVTVFENKIPYSFDITRVMFCSGNVTERMRMAQQRSQGQVVVDLYCGVGYYTVPLLLHGGAQHVHACEWNPNSVLALRENLRRAGVAARCTVYEGDNRITSTALDSLADRVLLGLLPSSVQGWPLAARALKATGGAIHVHENVHEAILDTWVEETRAQFEQMLQAQGKPLKVSVVHLERVKSYAPRVYHVVLDLDCVPSLESEVAL